MWIDTHCHLDAREFDRDRDGVVARARSAGVMRLVLPAVDAASFEVVRGLAHRHDLAYALGIHPMATGAASDADLDRLAGALHEWRDDPRLVAVGEIGLDGFVGGLDPARQLRFCAVQLRLARDAGLPVIVHSRRAVDPLLKQLRTGVAGGIAHAFNGSRQQADAMLAQGMRLGFGGALTFERALRIRALARELPDAAIVLETDSPDIPPHWLYRTAAERAQGATMRNEPAELPRIAAVLAELRGVAADALAATTGANACAALPRLAALA
ncbi:MAG TPA: TatD family hydrolase [Caldimonas sp.]|nr:TatD family hydrolase [Caldimonas sp.]